MGAPIFNPGTPNFNPRTPIFRHDGAHFQMARMNTELYISNWMIANRSIHLSFYFFNTQTNRLYPNGTPNVRKKRPVHLSTSMYQIGRPSLIREGFALVTFFFIWRRRLPSFCPNIKELLVSLDFFSRFCLIFDLDFISKWIVCHGK